MNYFTKSLSVLASAALFFGLCSISIAQVATLEMPAVENSTLEKSTVEIPTALVPVPQTRDWWPTRHAEKLAERDANAESIQLVFVGDSITHGWDKRADIQPMWDKYFGHYGAFNIGYGGDKTENVLWRLQGEENEIAGLSPKLFVMMIGTNNTGHRMDAAENTVAGIEAIVDRLLENCPESKVLLLAVFPRSATPDDPKRVLNDEINASLAKIDWADNVEYLDINHIFLDEKGMLPRNVMPDLLHPNKKGYQLWAGAIDAPIKRLMGE